MYSPNLHRTLILKRHFSQPITYFVSVDFEATVKPAKSTLTTETKHCSLTLTGPVEHFVITVTPLFEQISKELP